MSIFVVDLVEDLMNFRMQPSHSVRLHNHSPFPRSAVDSC